VELFKPRGASKIRNATSDQQQNGQIYNPPRFAHLGGFSGASKAGTKSKMGVEKPGDGKKVI